MNLARGARDPASWSRQHSLRGDSNADRKKANPIAPDPLVTEKSEPEFKDFDYRASEIAENLLKYDLQQQAIDYAEAKRDGDTATKMVSKVLAQAYANEIVKGQRDREIAKRHMTFLHNFREWLRGNGLDEEYQRAGMDSYTAQAGPNNKRGKNMLISKHPTVLAYLESMQERVIDYERKKAQMKLRLGNMQKSGDGMTLMDAWNYYKHVVQDIDWEYPQSVNHFWPDMPPDPSGMKASHLKSGDKNDELLTLAAELIAKKAEEDKKRDEDARNKPPPPPPPPPPPKPPGRPTPPRGPRPPGPIIPPPPPSRPPSPLRPDEIPPPTREQELSQALEASRQENVRQEQERESRRKAEEERFRREVEERERRLAEQRSKEEADKKAREEAERKRAEEQRQQMETLNKTLRDLQSALEKANQERAQAESELNAHKEALSKADRASAMREQTLKNAQDRLRQSNEQIRSLSVERDKARQEAALMSQRANARPSIDEEAAKKAVEEANARVETVTRQLNILKQKANQTEEHLAHIEQRPEFQKVVQEKTQLQEQLQISQQQMNQMAAQVSALSTELQRTRAGSAAQQAAQPSSRPARGRTPAPSHSEGPPIRDIHDELPGGFNINMDRAYRATTARARGHFYGK